MSRMRRRRRNNRTFDVRQALEARAGYYSDLATATPRQRATALVVECGDLLLELLITTATELLKRTSRRERSRDEEALTLALDDHARVERAWVFLAHGLVQWTLGGAVAAGAANDVSTHQAALRLLDEHYPLDEQQRSQLATAPKASELGMYSEELVLTSEAFEALLGDEAGSLALFNDLDPMIDMANLEISFKHGATRYMELVLAGVAGTQ